MSWLFSAGGGCSQWSPSQPDTEVGPRAPAPSAVQRLPGLSRHPLERAFSAPCIIWPQNRVLLLSYGEVPPSPRPLLFPRNTWQPRPSLPFSAQLLRSDSATPLERRVCCPFART